MSHLPFRRVRIEPVQCLVESWRRIADQYWLFLGITCVGMLLGSLAPLGILLGPMMCGINLCYLQKWRGAVVRFELLFKGFDHFVESLIAVLIQMLVGMAITIPLMAVGFLGVMLVVALAARGGHPAQALLVVAAIVVGYVFLILVATLVGTLFAFTFILIVDRGLTGPEAVKQSAQAVWGNLGGVLGLSLLSALLGLAGACACYVGVFFVLPITFGAIVAAYDRVFGIEPAPAMPAAAAAEA